MAPPLIPPSQTTQNIMLLLQQYPILMNEMLVFFCESIHPSAQLLSQILGTQPRGNQSSPSGSGGASPVVVGGVVGGIVSNGDGLRYDLEAPVHRIDLGCEDQYENGRVRDADDRQNASHGITVNAAMEKLGLHDPRDLLPGLEVRLLPHQAIGVNWMLDQERNTPRKGGILARHGSRYVSLDDPGEGDTHRPTLIVVPAALLLQWKEEIETKTNGMFSVHIRHGREKTKSLPKLADKDLLPGCCRCGQSPAYDMRRSDFAA
ncbi:hypothetical protein SCP_1104310 [Sparassis crispa]|uniref:SNF2 N-terminal domain-containing protein n=1 Tax=Sparassis crispa TaxID=139825 RepID=A0A401H015_9APHY|nr:hypothetical protein SCP_1104310 [Sparassis crispa]GBE87754.1 hypothetical protein SCP_1104310 [Sparassis crispa]